MDVNELRTAATLLSFLAFLGIMVWCWSRQNAAAFSEAAELPFRESPDAEAMLTTDGSRT